MASLRSDPRSIPSLDGIRALSVALVIVGHLRPPGPAAPFFLLFGNGDLGVSIFFVISGFLITGLLLKEKQKSGEIGLKNFYIRRSFRILPACYFMLATVLVLYLLGQVAIKPLTFFGAVFFFSNYTPILTSFVIAHTWSLAIEEQFYLLWPVVVSRLAPKTLVRVCLSLILLAPFVRVFHYFAFPSSRADMWQFTHIRYDGLMIGGAISLLKEDLRLKSLIAKAIQLKAHWFAVLFFWILSPILHRKIGGTYTMTVGYTLDAAAIGLAIIWATQLNSKTLAYRFLNSPVARHFGVLSYSLYLWQQVFTSRHSGVFSNVPICLVSIWGVAELSYAFIETPMMRARERFFNRRSIRTQSSAAEMSERDRVTALGFENSSNIL